jgi:ATP-dependent helicase Lhr and Lhr-like helicase
VGVPEGFGAATGAWFGSAFAAPTAAQAGAWKAISAGTDTLVVAPTGSGKTLAAFLWSLDRLASEPPPEPTRRCRVLYVSPLKALAVDIERNLRAPLAGIRQAAHRLGQPEPDITVGMRTGDTPATERRAFTRTPPDILITTPESLFLLLTSAARESLRGVETVIVDEVHAMCATKRGAHLALSLERLDALLARPAQRIGLSATVRPIDETARFLGGARPVTVVNPPAGKTVELSVQVPVEDMIALDEAPEESEDAPARRASIWPAVENRVLDLVLAHRSTIVFANSRRLAERLCARLNELHAERVAGQPLPDPERFPAEAVGESGVAAGAPAVIARAHHGSVSREERKHIEEELKSGRLPAVVATSSLELGIDMGAVDLVVQVEAPPSVASGLQRVGRAGHQVGAPSVGVVFPKHRGDLAPCTVVATRMRRGAIEELRYPRNPLDVLAQQIVAMVALDDWTVDEVAAVARRAAPFAELPDSALRAVLDMLAGRYPSQSFAELRPRLVWDRTTDRLSARPGAQRLAVVSGGTIPDRGLFGVYLAGAEKAARVGELDEEMVYESRVGDVFLLGSTSWRIEDITPDRVLVSPAPGQAARMPFWKGDTVGRPAELGAAIGGLLRELSGGDGADLLRDAGLDEYAAANLLRYVAEQRETAGTVPDDRTVLVERFRDELGDWRLVVHSVFGQRVNAPWALAITARLRERYGVEAQAQPADDGIVVRLPDTADEPPGADEVAFDADELDALVRETVGTSALFAARFRECAARALLLPRRDPRRRRPLWQQRQRAAQLLDVARDFADFPIMLEAARECLRDVFDMPALADLMRSISTRSVRLVEVETPRASPFARSLLFGYVGAFLYEGDAPLAERRAAALELDPTLLAELLGAAELRELLDPAVVAETEQRLQWLTPDRAARDVEDAAELLRLVGDLSTAEAADRGIAPEWLDELVAARRAIVVRIAGTERYLAIEDAGRVRDALGAALPVGVPEAFTEPVADPLGDLVLRYSRTHAPFTAATAAARFGLGVAVVEGTLRRLAATGRVVTGEFTPGGAGAEWCDAEVLRILRRRSLAALRKEIEPSPPAALAAFLPRWQHVGEGNRGVDAVAAAVEQLAGAAIPASALERLVLPARVADYSPAYLDQLCASGEVVWAGAGALPSADGYLVLAYSDAAELLLPPPDPAAAGSPLHAALLAALDGGQALFLRDLAERVAAELGTVADEELTTALWDLVWAGYLSNDTLAPLRALLAGSGTHRSRPSAPRSTYRRPGRALRHGMLPTRAGPPTAAGRWYRLPDRDADPTRCAAARAEVLLERHGVLTRGAVTGEQVPGGFAGVYPVLAALEERGAARRGYFVESLGAAQFAVPGAVDRLRTLADRSSDVDRAGWSRRVEAPRPLVLAATDPANPYGAALPWPERPASDATATGHRPGRKAGALVVLVDGALALYVERGGRTILSYVDSEEALRAAADALAAAVRSGALGSLAVERADGAPITGTALSAALSAAGFRVTPRGLRLRS